MRSSNYKHSKNDSLNVKRTESVKKHKKPSKIASLAVAVFVVVSAVVIPNISLAQNVAAVSDEQKSTAGVGDAEIFNDIIVTKTRKKTTKPVKSAVVTETEPQTETVVEDETEAALEQAEAEELCGALAQHIELSDYDRTLLEGLVMGEAGGCGYETSALVAQAVHDSMIESGTTSVEQIAAEYKYDASMFNVPTQDVKDAVSFIFDSDGRAVDHRILYFYASDIVTSDWHESQNFVTSCSNMRFFDKW